MKRFVPVVLLATVLSPWARTASAESPPPNVVILMSDDQRWDTISPTFTPEIWDNLVNTGSTFPGSRSTMFTNAFVPNSLCCPSRTSILTGRYSHTTGVYSNTGPFGGFKAFDDKHTIATDFHDAGYRTALIGKYLNGYVPRSTSYVPPGWDRWFAVNTGAFYDYYASSNGHPLFYGDDPADYITRVLNQQATAFVEDATDDGDPFLLYYAFTAPHEPAVPQQRDVGRFASVPLPQPPSYNVADDPTGAGKPAYIRDQPVQDPTALHERQLESEYGVDRAIGQLLAVLPSNTIVVYLSDNGWLWGEHRWAGKLVPYNESIRIPMILTSLDGSFTLPGAWAPDDLTLNVDLRPTLEAAAGVPLSTSVDGLDWASDPPRGAFVLEHGGDTLSYCGVREAGWMYTRYSDGFEELYNENADPYEMSNLASDPIPVGAQTAYDRLTAEMSSLCRPAPPGVLLDPKGVLGGPADQSSAFRNDDWLTWTMNSGAHPKTYDAFAKDLATGQKIRLNKDGTHGRSGNFIPGTDRTIYTQTVNWSGDLYYLNLRTGSRKQVPGVNTKASEHDGRVSASYVLFDRDRVIGGIRYTRLLLQDRADGSLTSLGRWKTAKVSVVPGSIGEGFASYSLVEGSGSRSFVYDIADSSATQIPAGAGNDAWGPTIDETDGSVYFASSSGVCGVNVSLRRLGLDDLDGPQTTLTILAPGVGATGLSLAPGAAPDHTDLLFTAAGCTSGSGDINQLLAVDTV